MTAAVLAAINSWLAGRENVAEDVRAQRIASYPAIWHRTGVVSRWPRTDAGLEQFLRLHEDLRRWYYAGGGLYLSTRARERYERLQLVLEAVASVDETEARECYPAVMQAASYFRTGLTDDLETRQRRSLVAALARRRADRADRAQAADRLRAVTAMPAAAGSRPPVHPVGPDDEELRLDGPASGR